MRIELSLRSIFAVIAIVLGLWLLGQLWQILLLIVEAAVLAASLNPVLTWLQAHGVKRTIALGLILIAMVASVVGLGALVVPAMAAQVSAVIAGAPELQARIADALAGVPVLGERAAALRDSPPTDLAAPAAKDALPFALQALEGMVLGLTAVVMAFYFLADKERTIGFLYALLPRRYHVRTARILQDMERIVGGYVRGQAITSGISGVFVFALLWIVGAPNALALAVLAAVADAIPFIGIVITLIPAAGAGLAVGPGTALIVVVAFLAFQEFESRILIPRVYGQALRLSPVVVIVALLVGGKLLGIIGALLALPMAAGIRVLIEDLRIDLPGEVPGEKTERAIEEHADAVYEARTAGAPAVEAAQVAAELAQEVHTQVQREAGDDDKGDTPIADRRDARPAA